MATVLMAPVEQATATERIPRLQNGDRLTRAEFERRYQAMPDVKKAELIEGEVFMPSPVSFLDHAEPHSHVVAWLALYKMITPGVRIGDNGTLRLDLDNEPQPDAFAIIDPDRGGQAQISADGYIEGAPELIVEVSSSSVSIDMHRKLNVYRRNGVMEYVVWRVQDRAIDWFVFREGVYERLGLDAEGLYRSEVLPGLILDPVAMIEGDLLRVSEAQSQTSVDESHAGFLKRLSGAAGSAVL